MYLKRKTKWLLLGVVAILATLLLAASVGLFYLIHTSMLKPGSGGTIAGLKAEVRIEQDGFGVPTIKGNSIADIYRAQGWVMARDRLFQMDLLRRRSAGRLAEIFGMQALRFDKLHRKFGFAHIAKAAASQMQGRVRERMQAFTDGVNAFMQQGPRPFEMRLLGYHPEPWEVSDSILVVLAMFEDLDFYPQVYAEKALTALYAKRPKALADFLTPIAGFLDSPALPDQQRDLLPTIPSVDLFDLRNEQHTIRTIGDRLQPRASVGSNAWVIAGRLTKSGLPIVAGDPHLFLYLPNIWYRLRLQGGGLQVSGIGLPGVPGVVMGSNGHVAWTMTASYGDTIDLVEVPKSAKHQIREEVISIRGEEPITLEVQESKWGPIVERIHEKEYALEWTAQDVEEIAQSDVTELNLAGDVHALIKALSKWQGPTVNLLFGTKAGDIGWLMVGNIPKRIGFEGRYGVARDPYRYWDGTFTPSQLPRLINPASGMIINANQRMVPILQDSIAAKTFGYNHPSPSRAYRIRERLSEKRGWSAKEIYSIQLDIFSHQLLFYRQLLATALKRLGQREDPWQQAMATLIKAWDGKASVDSAAYPLLRKFRLQLFAHLLEPLWGLPLSKDAQSGKEFWPLIEWYYHEPVLKQLLAKKPAHLLVKQFPSYDAAVVDAAVTAAKSLVQSADELQQLRWGDFNRSQIHHPFSQGLPDFFGKHFRLPVTEISGDHWVPKVATRFHGQFLSSSMRMVVDLANAQNSIFNHAGGQSGHYHSAHFDDQYEAWLQGLPTSFEPGATTVTDVLVPKP